MNTSYAAAFIDDSRDGFLALHSGGTRGVQERRRVRGSRLLLAAVDRPGICATTSFGS